MLEAGRSPDHLISKFRLQDYTRPKDGGYTHSVEDNTRLLLAKWLIRITVDDHDPTVPARLRTVCDELDAMNFSSWATTEAGPKARLF